MYDEDHDALNAAPDSQPDDEPTDEELDAIESRTVDHPLGGVSVFSMRGKLLSWSWRGEAPTEWDPEFPALRLPGWDGMKRAVIHDSWEYHDYEED